MSLKRFVDVPTVASLLKKGIINRDGVRLLDCTYTIGPKLDWKQHKEQLYGNFELIANAPTQSKQLYLSGHIPEAVHISLDAAMYPSKYERFAIYPPEVFEKYVQLLGIDKDEHLIFYGRGAMGGMMFPARFAWLFKSYGHTKISVIDGGYGQWTKKGNDIATDDFKLNRKGNWVAEDKLADYNITFEELEAKKEGEEKELMAKTDENNFLDARIRAQFEGTQDTGLDPYRVSGSHIPGFKNCPAAELITEEGTMKSKEEIGKWLISNGMRPNQAIFTNCNTGLQASMLAYSIEDAVDTQPRLYNGSLKEMEIRDPKKISAGNCHLPVQN